MLLFDTLQENEKTVFLRALRQALYILAVLVFIIIMDYAARFFQTNAFAEHGIIENIQLGILALTAVTFSLTAFKNADYRAIFLFCASLCVFAFLRELDGFFEKIFPIIKWKFAFIFPIIALYNLYKKRYQIRPYFFNFLSSSAFYMMSSAIIIAIPLAQRLGHKPFIRTILQVDSIHHAAIRRMTEETIESVGYFLLFLSAIECIILFKNASKAVLMKKDNGFKGNKRKK